MSLFRKPSTCKCGGGYLANSSRWVVIERREAPQSSHLKCLACSWKWWSTASYVEKLRDHVEKSFSGATDQDILDRIEDGTLFIDVNNAWVFSLSRGNWRELRIITRESNGSSYRFVEVYGKPGKKKKIALHRLVWMAANRQVVPDGYDVDHINGKVSDGIDNLRLLESSLNRSIGKPVVKQQEELPF